MVRDLSILFSNRDSLGVLISSDWKNLFFQKDILFFCFQNSHILLRIKIMVGHTPWRASGVFLSVRTSTCRYSRKEHIIVDHAEVCILLSLNFFDNDCQQTNFRVRFCKFRVSFWKFEFFWKFDVPFDLFPKVRESPNLGKQFLSNF